MTCSRSSPPACRAWSTQRSGRHPLRFTFRGSDQQAVSHESGPPEEGAELWRAVHSGEPLGLGGAAQRLGEHEDVLERELLTFTDVEAISVK